ncbi:MAG: hypothetical protein ACJ75H_17380 [Thermoanaerobaculia bacterium]
MFNRLLPERIDNTYRGHVLGLWLFGLVVTARILQGLVVTFNAYSVAKSADGIPLDTFAPDAAQTVAALFALSGLYRLVIAVLCVVVLVRYRGALVLMYALLVLESLAKLLLLRVMPFATTGAPPGPMVNLTLATLLVAGLVLALWPERAARAEGNPPG